MTTKLLPCPFCGREGLLLSSGEVTCGHCNIKLPLKNWNTRTHPLLWTTQNSDGTVDCTVVINKVEFMQDGEVDGN